MKIQKDPHPSREDELKAENALLKFKLGLEHGMKMHEFSELPADVENQWLKNVYAFEEQFKDARRITVYDYIGRPEFKKWDTLSSEEVIKELDAIELLLARHNLELDCICNYDKIVIYKFITEELFNHEMDDMRIPGMVYHFIYEEFHPNHDYDLRKDSEAFVNTLFERVWDPEFDTYKLAKGVSFSGTDYDRAGISGIIKTFQEAHESFEVEKFEVVNVAIGSALTHANVRADLLWSGRMKHNVNVRHSGPCAFDFVREHEAWSLAGFAIPGFTRMF